MDKYSNYALELNKALKSQPINTRFLINLVKLTDNLERQFIREYYFNLTNVDLIEDLKSLRNIEGNSFEYLLIGLFRSPTEYDVYEIFEAVDGVGTNEDTLSEIVGTRSRDPFRIQEIKRFYSVLFSSQLEDVLVAEELPMEYISFLKSILFSDYSNFVTVNDIEASLKNLNELGRKKMESKLEIFAKILLIKNNSTFLKELNEKYSTRNKRSLNELIEKEFNNPLKSLMIYTLNAQSDFLKFYAERLINALKSEKKDTKRIIRSMISIYPVNMTEFRDVLSLEYKIDLDDFITKNTQGLFRDLLLAVASSDNLDKDGFTFASISQ
jgi:hypothetical protein